VPRDPAVEQKQVQRNVDIAKYGEKAFLPPKLRELDLKFAKEIEGSISKQNTVAQIGYNRLNTKIRVGNLPSGVFWGTSNAKTVAFFIKHGASKESLKRIQRELGVKDPKPGQIIVPNKDDLSIGTITHELSHSGFELLRQSGSFDAKKSFLTRDSEEIMTRMFDSISGNEGETESALKWILNHHSRLFGENLTAESLRDLARKSTGKASEKARIVFDQIMKMPAYQTPSSLVPSGGTGVRGVDAMGKSRQSALLP